MRVAPAGLALLAPPALWVGAPAFSLALGAPPARADAVPWACSCLLLAVAAGLAAAACVSVLSGTPSLEVDALAVWLGA